MKKQKISSEKIKIIYKIIIIITFYLIIFINLPNKSLNKKVLFKKSTNKEVIQNSERSKNKFDLDFCSGRSLNFSYIFIIRA